MIEQRCLWRQKMVKKNTIDCPLSDWIGLIENLKLKLNALDKEVDKKYILMTRYRWRISKMG